LQHQQQWRWVSIGSSINGVGDSPMAMTMVNNWYSGTLFHRNGHIKQDNGRLKNGHTDDLFHQIIFGNHGVHANH